MSPRLGVVGVAVLVVVMGLVVGQAEGAASTAQCQVDCVSPLLFTTNTDPSLWEGPTNGNITFCNATVNYDFCPNAWELNGTVYQVSQMDVFAQDFYNQLLAVHEEGCNDKVPGNNCASCAPHLAHYTCLVAFPPCANKTILEVCYSACTAVRPCRIALDCKNNTLSPTAVKGDDQCVGAASSLFSSLSSLLLLSALLLAAFFPYF